MHVARDWRVFCHSLWDQWIRTSSEWAYIWPYKITLLWLGTRVAFHIMRYLGRTLWTINTVACKPKPQISTVTLRATVHLDVINVLTQQPRDSEPLQLGGVSLVIKRVIESEAGVRYAYSLTGLSGSPQSSIRMLFRWKLQQHYIQTLQECDCSSRAARRCTMAGLVESDFNKETKFSTRN